MGYGVGESYALESSSLWVLGRKNVVQATEAQKPWRDTRSPGFFCVRETDVTLPVWRLLGQSFDFDLLWQSSLSDWNRNL